VNLDQENKIQWSELTTLTASQILPPTLQNLQTLLAKLNQLRNAYDKPLRITSGLRSMEDHLRIYREKGITDPAKIPMHSAHLIGAAADMVPLEDDIKHLHDWVLDNVKLMESIGLWFEDFDYTKTWVHAQIYAPKSGKRFFIP
jgi:hypothetical protein